MKTGIMASVALSLFLLSQGAETVKVEYKKVTEKAEKVYAEHMPYVPPGEDCQWVPVYNVALEILLPEKRCTPVPAKPEKFRSVVKCGHRIFEFDDNDNYEKSMGKSIEIAYEDKFENIYRTAGSKITIVSSKILSTHNNVKIK